MKITSCALHVILIYVCVFLFSNFSLADEARFENTLFIADSHGYGKFGVEIDKYLRTISTNTTSIASCGSSPSTWVNTTANFKATNCGFWKKESDGKEIRVKSHKQSSFTEEIENVKPNLTVVALGTNILTSPQSIEKEKLSIEKMLTQIKQAKSKCIWIGPPDVAKNPFKANLEKGVQEIKALVEKNKCVFIDSTEITKYPKDNKDGIHYGATQAGDWGIDAAEKMNQKILAMPVAKKASAKIKSKPKTDSAN
ncbi:MAG: SGNH/GDSL hydrolase family protein [Bdellovibrio sp.]|nr:SGNH/GDSL hydrolase family protein [Bdellovibrio sp.]